MLPRIDGLIDKPMGIQIYRPNEHPGGFIGARVVVSFPNRKIKQQYFSEARYGDEMLQEAEKLEQRWKIESAIAGKDARVYGTTCWEKSQIAIGLRADIYCYKKQRKSGIKQYFQPTFFVRVPGVPSEKIFNIRKLGYRQAYIQAAKLYSETHQLNSSEALSLMAKMPDKSLFTDYLLPRAKERYGIALTKKALREVLDA